MIEIVGWIGGALAVLAYAIVTRYGTSVLFHCLNFAGASGLLANAMYHRALPLLALNFVWGFIAACGIATMALRRNKVAVPGPRRAGPPHSAGPRQATARDRPAFGGARSHNPSDPMFNP